MRHKILRVILTVIICIAAVAIAVGIYYHVQEEKRIASFQKEISINDYEFWLGLGEIVIPTKEMTREEAVVYYREADFDAAFSTLEDNIDEYLQIGVKYQVNDLVPPYNKVGWMADLLNIIHDSKQTVSGEAIGLETADQIAFFQRYASTIISNIEIASWDLENAQFGNYNEDSLFIGIAPEAYEKIYKAVQLALSSPFTSERDKNWLDRFFKTYDWNKIKCEYMKPRYYTRRI